MSESITVSGQAPLLDTTSALNQTVMDRQVLDVLPGTNDLWGIARVVPSIVMNKYDVGGSESFQQSKITVHGSNPDGESQYQIDGMNIDAAVGATGNVTMYYDRSCSKRSTTRPRTGRPRAPAAASSTTW